MFNPFLPHMMAFSSNWSMRKGAKHIDEATKIEEFAANIYPLNLFAIVLWVLLLLCIPTAILSSGTGIVFFAAVCATYATILTMLAVLCLKRIELGMSSRQFFYIALDCIACPPFSINLVRKVTWQYKTNFDPIEFAVKNLDRDELVKLIQLLISRLDEQLLLEDEHTNKSDKIEAYRLKLLELTR